MFDLLTIPVRRAETALADSVVDVEKKDRMTWIYWRTSLLLRRERLRRSTRGVTTCANDPPVSRDRRDS